MLGIVHDEHAFHIELDAAFVIAIEQVKRRLCRNIKQRGITLVAFDLVVYPGLWILEVVTDMLVEFLVFIIRNIFLVPGPQR